MDDITLGDVLKKIRADLDWRGSQGSKGIGHIVLTREEAEFLHKSVIAIIIERDDLVYEKEHLKEQVT